MFNTFFSGGRLTKAQIIEYVKNEVYATYGVYPETVIYIEEVPEIIRHSCVNTGITTLPRRMTCINTQDGVLDVPYFVCPVCGKLYVYRE